ncbi:helicase SNF2 [Clostridia bacterium]|nr:helicase SNF2 [Clostridia bacterium]
MNFYPHQTRCLEQTANRNRVAYYLDMGLGKTFIGAEKMKRFGTAVNLIVCQKSKVDDWVNHLVDNNYEHHFRMIYDCTKWNKGDWEAFGQTANEPCMLIVNYDLIFRRKQFLNLDKFTLMLDESSLIQNDTAKRTKFILKLNPSNVILLSGTPTAGKYENLWSQINLLGWEISEKAFNRQYINWTTIDVEGFPKKVVDKANPYKNVERMKRKMREHGAVFIKTEEVVDLPQQNIVEIHVSTTREYKRFQKTSLVTVQGQELVGDSILSKRLYSRMLCGHFNADKLNALRELCESTNDRLIVFYNYDAELEALRQICAEIDRPVSEVNGHTKDLTAYESDEDSITLVQYKAGAMGLNLQKANKVIYFTPTEEAELWQQSMKRIHRIGQTRPCFYYLLLCANSIETEEIIPTLGIRKDYTDELFKEKQ